MKTAHPDKYRVLFDSSQDAHMIFIDGLGIVDCNEATVRLLGCSSKDQVLRIHVAELSPEYQPDGQRSLEKARRMDATAREKGWHRFEWIHKKADGSEFPVEVTLNAVEIDGKPGLIAVWHDLTEIKEKENRLRSMADELRWVNTSLVHANDRMRAELEMAAETQKSLLPQASPFFPGIRAEWFFRPSRELAGDSLNIFRIDERRLGFYVLDVSGHGVSSALLSVTVTQFLTSFQATGVSASRPTERFGCPATCAARLNDHFSANVLAGHFFTLVYGVLDTESLDFSYVAAGQAGPVIVRRDGSVESCDSTAIPVGLLPSAEFGERRLRLSPGDRIYLFSDGFYEAKKADSEEYGLTRLVPFLETMNRFPLKESVDRLVREIDHWAHPAPPHDDLSLVGVEIVTR